MIFSVCNEGFEWFLEFEPVSVTLSVKDLVLKIIRNSEEIPVAPWSLLLSQKQDLLVDHPGRVPITLNQEGTTVMRNEVLSSVSAQDMETSGYQRSDLDLEFYWEKDQLDIDTDFSPGIETFFSSTSLDDSETGSMPENPILIDEDQDKENSHPL